MLTPIHLHFIDGCFLGFKERVRYYIQRPYVVISLKYLPSGPPQKRFAVLSNIKNLIAKFRKLQWWEPWSLDQKPRSDASISHRDYSKLISFHFLLCPVYLQPYFFIVHQLWLLTVSATFNEQSQVTEATISNSMEQHRPVELPHHSGLQLENLVQSIPVLTCQLCSRMACLEEPSKEQLFQMLLKTLSTRCFGEFQGSGSLFLLHVFFSLHQ